MIPFNVPAVTGNEVKYINQAIQNQKFSGDGMFTAQCNSLLEERFSARKVLLTTSCTHALEMAAILSGVGEGDEVIMSSFTFVSTANAFVLRGAKIVFVDIEPQTLNINADLIEDAVTSKTKVIVPVHYAGVSCNMNKIMEIAEKYDLIVVEDAAQGVMSTYNNKPLGTIGHFGCYSFHETKNYQCGEGGAIVINDERYIERSEIIREKGTDRSRFFRGQVDKYSWVDKGSSYLPSELNAAFLYAQLEALDEINSNRLMSWLNYDRQLMPLVDKGYLETPYIPESCQHNAHMYYIKVKDLEMRSALIQYLKDRDILTVFHYIPLHSAKAGLAFGRFEGDDLYTTSESEKLIRLPMYYGLELETIQKIVATIIAFFNENGRVL